MSKRADRGSDADDLLHWLDWLILHVWSRIREHERRYHRGKRVRVFLYPDDEDGDRLIPPVRCAACELPADWTIGVDLDILLPDIRAVFNAKRYGATRRQVEKALDYSGSRKRRTRS